MAAFKEMLPRFTLSNLHLSFVNDLLEGTFMYLFSCFFTFPRIFDAFITSDLK